MQKAHLGSRVRRVDGQEYQICGRAEFSHQITLEQAVQIAMIACGNCAEQHVPFVDFERDVESTTPDEAVVDVFAPHRAQDDSYDSNTIVWGK